MIDLLGGRVQVMFDTIPQAIDYIRDGKLRALAVTTATRSEVLPNVPAMSDFVPGFQAGSWWGLAAPKDTNEACRCGCWSQFAMGSQARPSTRTDGPLAAIRATRRASYEAMLALPGA
jgi:hypothetical protein